MNDIYGRAGRLHLEVATGQPAWPYLAMECATEVDIGVRQFQFGRLEGHKTVGCSTSWRRRDCVRRFDNFGPPFAPRGGDWTETRSFSFSTKDLRQPRGCARGFQEFCLTLSLPISVRCSHDRDGKSCSKHCPGSSCP
jgi:hypothetical protein